MLWRTEEGIRLEDLLPVPKKQPGRHFSSGYHLLGHLAPSYDVKYAQMTYGDHYRKKIEEEISRERSRLEDILMEPKQRATNYKQAMSGSKKITNKGYDLNELRHHQRRCAALLFGARQQGAHEVPYMVRWAPRRRESYYLMSERVYNDRLLMKLREQEEEEKRKMLAESPMVFDFGNKFGNTSHLYDFQKFISKTSKDIQGLSFDSEYKDYGYEFNEDEKRKVEEQQGRVIITPTNHEQQTKSKMSKESRVQFGDVTDFESDHYEGRLSRERKRANLASNKSGELDMNDIDVDVFSDARGDLSGEGSPLSNLLGVMSLQGSSGAESKPSKGSRKNYSSNSKFGGERSDLLSIDDDMSLFTDQNITDEAEESETKELDHGISELGSAHNNKYCKHSPTSSLKKRSQDYYKSLPRLLRTSELREKAAASVRPTDKKSPRPGLAPYVDHKCMVPYKTAYERALALVRGRSLPDHPADLFNRTTRLTFSYMPGMPGTESVVLTSKSSGETKLSTVNPVQAEGLKGILGDVNMNNFYREEDELIYYVGNEELNVVVESSADTTESRGDDDNDDETHDDSSEALTRTTSEVYTLGLKSSMNTDNEST